MNESPDMTVVLRPFDPREDTPFIYSFWRHSLWFGDPINFGKDRLAAAFYSDATKRIRAILKDSRTEIRIACAKESPILILGFSVRRGDHLEFIFVKQDYQRNGIATMLATGIMTVAEPTTIDGQLIAKTKNLKIEENADGKTKEAETNSASGPGGGVRQSGSDRIVRGE